jgi:hypothetical protein
MARIEFGPDTSYGLTATVDLEQPNCRTLLLGMTPSTEHHFRIVASGAGSECVSDDFTITTEGVNSTSHHEPAIRTRPLHSAVRSRRL